MALSGSDAVEPLIDALPEIEVTVELISDQPLPPAAKLFVFARASEGPPMPLAVVRAEPTRGRSTHRLTDALAMMPSLRLSQFDVVDVVARLSFSGQISDQSNDLESKAEKLSLTPGVQSLSLVLDLTEVEARSTKAQR
jgi:cytochrome c-type biogenesis protein CcmH